MHRTRSSLSPAASAPPSTASAPASPAPQHDSPRLSLLHRWGIVALKHLLRWSHKRITLLIGCSESTVSRTLHNYDEDGNVKNRPRSGRPALVPRGSSQEAELERILKTYRTFTPALIAGKFRESPGKAIRPQSIKRLAYRLNFRRVRTSKRPLLTEAHKVKRLYFAEESVGEEWDDVVFTDEKLFEYDSGGVVWKRPEETPIPNYCPNQRIKWMVWGGVWKGGRTRLAFMDDTVDAEEYQNVLWEYFIEPSDYSENPFLHLLQDNALPHKAASTMEYLNNFEVDLVENYPPNSPDLNAIEKVWGWMKNYIETRGPSTPPAYKELIRESWENIPQQTIDNFISHTPTVITHIIAAEGGNSS